MGRLAFLQLKVSPPPQSPEPFPSLLLSQRPPPPPRDQHGGAAGPMGHPAGGPAAHPSPKQQPSAAPQGPLIHWPGGCRTCPSLPEVLTPAKTTWVAGKGQPGPPASSLLVFFRYPYVGSKKKKVEALYFGCV